MMYDMLDFNNMSFAPLFCCFALFQIVFFMLLMMMICTWWYGDVWRWQEKKYLGWWCWWWNARHVGTNKIGDPSFLYFVCKNVLKKTRVFCVKNAIKDLSFLYSFLKLFLLFYFEHKYGMVSQSVNWSLKNQYLFSYLITITKVWSKLKLFFN